MSVKPPFNESVGYPRRYPDTMEMVPDVLPISYNISPYSRQRCDNCMYFYPENSFCKNWGVTVRPNYWCGHWLRGEVPVEA